MAIKHRTITRTPQSLAVIAIGAAILFAQTPSGIRGVVAADARVELVQEGFMFTEGPVGTADGGLYKLATLSQGPRRLGK